MTAISASTNKHSFLRRVLGVDAASCVAMGLLLFLGSGLLAELLALPRLLLEYAGLSLFPIAGFIAWVATRSNLSRPMVWIVIVGNLFWVVGSVALLINDVLSPNVLGYAFIAGQAATVALLAELEYIGLRRAEPAVRSSIFHS